VRVVVAATAEVAIPTLDWLKKSQHDLVGVVTTPDSRSGRGKSLTPSPVAEWATANSLHLTKPETDSQMIESFQSADIVIAIAYGKIIPRSVLKVPRYGFLNLHFSLLPAYRGAAPVQRALQNGESVTGISIFQIDENLDTGPIFYQEIYNIASSDNTAAVLKDLSRMGALAFDHILNGIVEGAIPTVQSVQGVSLAPKISKEEARINWCSEAFKVINHIRAFTPAPGAWTTFRDSTIKISDVSKNSSGIELHAGAISIMDRKLFVGTSDFALEVITLTPAGKSEMLASDWINGARILPGDVFE